jgi:biotin-(acetyl-CoA carboxylase) ligase
MANTSTPTFSFKVKNVTKKLLSAIPERSRVIISHRFGLDKNVEKMTLEAIGENYDITRERVRQIEANSIVTIRKSTAFKEESKVFEELALYVKKIGGIISEHDLLNHLSRDESTQNHYHFLLIIGDQFKKEKETEEFHHRWHVDSDLSKKIHDALKKLYTNLDDNSLIPENEMIKSFMDNIKDISEELKNDEISKRWLRISKHIDKNPLGEWGKSVSTNVKVKGIRDYAYLAMRKHGSPVHFKEIAKLIQNVFGKRAHEATTHNELIKDNRFVLVGRGLYALAEWGYVSGVVKDVIVKVLNKNGPMTREEIFDKVMKERYVKENTILVNLQNSSVFKKDSSGKYHVIAEK